jgi:hypothetical protein
MKGIDVGGRINLKLFLKKKGMRGIDEHVDEHACPVKGLDFLGELKATHRRPGLSFDRFR